MLTISLEDLRNDHRLELLFTDARAQGWVKDCEADRLFFWAQAEHVARVSNRVGCPGRVFRSNVRTRLWTVISAQDEEAGRRRLAVMTNGPAVRDTPLPENDERRGDPGDGLSADAGLLKRAIDRARAVGVVGDPAAHILRNPPAGWGAGRIEAALEEIREVLT